MQPIRGQQVEIRPLAPSDRPLLERLAADATVLEWWPTLAADIESLLAGTGDEVTLAVDAEGDGAGIIQYWEQTEPEYRHAGIDIVLGAWAQGRGLGRDAVRTLARYLFDELGHERITIDPDAQNPRAIRCYEQVGFQRVGVMRAYERRPDGTRRDAVLLDLLPGDLA